MNVLKHDSPIEKIKTLMSWAYVLVYPFLLYISMETLNTAGEKANIQISLDTPIILISGLALLLMLMIIFCLVGEIFTAGLILTFIVGFVYVFSYYRLMLTGWVFVPSDLSLIKQTRDLVGFTNLSMFPALKTAAIITFPLPVLLYFASKRIKFKPRIRIASAGFLLVVFMLIFFTPYSRQSILPRFNVDVTVKQPSNQTYRQKGVLMGFYTSMFYIDEALVNYSEEYMLSLVEEVKSKVPVKPESAEPQEKPNVIVIMSEAFSDPKVFDNIGYTKEPMENITNLIDASKGSIISPVIGGGTCNTEYEFLTGNSIVYAGYNIKPYEKEDIFIPKEDERSLPALFGNNGYKTVSVHPYYSDFFNRDTIYPKLGFDKSIFLEDMEDPKYKGDYVSDEYFVDTILDLINSEDEPLFLFGISMQNHYCFHGEKYDDYDIKSTGDSLSEELKGGLDSYVQGVYDADKQYQRLIDEVSKSDRPTIVVFFGDHKPLIGKSAFELYTETGYVKSGDILEWTTEQKYKMFTTPYVVWNNFNMPSENLGDISPYFLGALTAEKAGIELNLYYKFLMQAYDSYHAFTDSLFVDTNDNVYIQPTPEARNAVSIFRAFQYDKINGSQYVDDLLAGM